MYPVRVCVCVCARTCTCTCMCGGIICSDIFTCFSDVTLVMGLLVHRKYVAIQLLVIVHFQVEDVNVSAVHRQTAAAYMASYIARSKFVSVE